MNGSEIYGKISPIRLFFTIAIPGAVSMIASSLWGIFDGIFVGKLLGEGAFAALNLAFPFVLLSFALADLVGVGSSVHISVCLGRKDEAGASNYFACACLLILLVSVLSGAVLYVMAPLLMQWMGADAALAEMGIRYLRVYALTSPVTSMIFAVDNFLRICGKIKGSMILNIVMSVLILGLEYLFLGVLGMDIGGSALAVSAGMAICTVIAFYPFFRGWLTLKFVKPKLGRTMLRQIVAGGSPMFLSSIAGRLTAIVMNVVLLKLGGSVAVSTYGILVAVGDTLQQLLYGTCDGMQPAIGYNWGAGSLGRVKALMKCSTIACAVISVAGAVLMILFPQPLASLFIQAGEQELLTMAGYAMSLYGLTYLTRWLGFAVQSFMVALEKPLPAAVLSVANALVIPVAVLPMLWPLGLDGIWLNTPITALLVSALSLVFFLQWSKTLQEKEA